MNHAIKYTRVHDLIEKYRIEKDKILSEEEADYSHIEERENNAFIGNYCFVDIRVKKKDSRNRIPSLNVTKADLLFDYETLLDKKRTYIIVDKDGSLAAFICHALEYFGYDCVYIPEGFDGFKRWSKANRGKN